MTEERFVCQFVQHDRKLHLGLWGVWDNKHSEYIRMGSKGIMNKITKLLNSDK
jgi:hypothetical protein